MDVAATHGSPFSEAGHAPQLQEADVVTAELGLLRVKKGRTNKRVISPDIRRSIF